MSKTENLCVKLIFWFIQIILWWLIAAYLLIKGKNDIPGIIFIVYIIYIILALCSPYLKLVFNRQSHKSLEDFFNYIKQLKPIYTILVNYTETKVRINEKNERVNFEQLSYCNENFKYTSWLDISGPYILDKRILNKKYLNLTVECLIDFADQQTASEYINQMYRIQNIYYNRVNNLTLGEHKSVENLNKNYLIKMSKEDGDQINLYVYILMTLICMIEIYKIYIDSQCCEQTYVLKKLISTSNDLSLTKYKKLFNIRTREENFKVIEDTPITIENIEFESLELYVPKPIDLEKSLKPNNLDRPNMGHNIPESVNNLKFKKPIKKYPEYLQNVPYSIENQIKSVKNINEFNLLFFESEESTPDVDKPLIDIKKEEIINNLQSNKRTFSEHFGVDVNSEIEGDPLIKKIKID